MDEWTEEKSDIGTDEDKPTEKKYEKKTDKST